MAGALAALYRRLEARGEIRGGRFVAGFVGEQFALPEAVDGAARCAASARRRRARARPAADPLNLVGILTPGPRVAAVLGNAVLYRDGVPIASREAGALVLRRELDPGASITPDLEYLPAAQVAAR